MWKCLCGACSPPEWHHTSYPPSLEFFPFETILINIWTYFDWKQQTSFQSHNTDSIIISCMATWFLKSKKKKNKFWKNVNKKQNILFLYVFNRSRRYIGKKNWKEMHSVAFGYWYVLTKDEPHKLPLQLLLMITHIIIHFYTSYSSFDYIFGI